VSLATRAAPALAATWMLTLPLPEPLAELLNVTHAAVLEALHEQPEAAMIEIVLAPPAVGYELPPGLMAVAHPLALITPHP